jgi:hypothetical protein
MNNFSFKLYFLLIFVSSWIFIPTLKAQDTLKILAIGNSFSEDAAETYLDDLAKADGVNLIVGNLYIGGCTLETHWVNAKGNLPAYSYRKITNGNKLTLENQTLLSAIKDVDWDIITYQQASPYSGMYATFFPYLTDLLTYVKANTINKNVKFAFHQTWAYAANSTHTGFLNYDNNQEKMYNAIVNAVNAAATHAGIDLIIPSGTAIQNGRNTSIGDNFNRDGYHLSYGLGRYTAACAWYEKLLNRPIIGNTFIPDGVTKQEADIAQHAAHWAVINPNNVTQSLYASTNQLYKRNLKFYPNPVISTAIIESEEILKHIEISDIAGRNVYAFSNITTQSTDLNLNHLIAGYYLLKTVNGTFPFLKINEL